MVYDELDGSGGVYSCGFGAGSEVGHVIAVLERISRYPEQSIATAMAMPRDIVEVKTVDGRPRRYTTRVC